MTRAASTTLEPILTPTARAAFDKHLVDVAGDDAQRGSAAARRHNSRSKTIRRQCNAAARLFGPDVFATEAPADTKAVEHVGHFLVERVDHLAAEAVGMLELHHSPAAATRLLRRAGIAVDYHDLTAPASQRDGGEQAGRTCADDDGSARDPSNSGI